jgi:hypothetical protein
MKVSTGNSWWRSRGFDEAETTVYFGAEIITNIFFLLAANVPLWWF